MNAPSNDDPSNIDPNSVDPSRVDPGNVDSSNVDTDPATSANDSQSRDHQDVPGNSENTNSQASQTEPIVPRRTNATQRRVLLNTTPPPPPYSRPSVWLPGRAPAPMPQSGTSWPPRSGRSRSTARARRAQVPVSDLIDLN